MTVAFLPLLIRSLCIVSIRLWIATDSKLKFVFSTFVEWIFVMTSVQPAWKRLKRIRKCCDFLHWHSLVYVPHKINIHKPILSLQHCVQTETATTWHFVSYKSGVCVLKDGRHIYSYLSLYKFNCFITTLVQNQSVHSSSRRKTNTTKFNDIRQKNIPTIGWWRLLWAGLEVQTGVLEHKSLAAA